MIVFLFILALAECLLLLVAGLSGKAQAARAAREHALAREDPPQGWPLCAMIIPVGGEGPQTEKALRSLLEQDYPNLQPIIVTAQNQATPYALLERLTRDYPALRHVLAPDAVSCGQKNANLLAGIASAGRPDIYVFCDSTHIAEKDFLRCLVNPIARGEAAFTTGYHQAESEHWTIPGLGYAMSVLFMRFMQGMASLTQPWGGALAMRRLAFEQYKVSQLWQTNVVDDCSLAPWLHRAGASVKLCPGALLRTVTGAHSLTVWRAWLERQILFLKFCMPGQWLILTVFGILLAVPPVLCITSIFYGLFARNVTILALAIFWLLLVTAITGPWRRFTPQKPGMFTWLCAFFCACGMFALVCLQTIFTRRLIWNKIIYNVGPGGVVQSIERPKT